MLNLYNETTKFMARNGHTLSDIEHVSLYAIGIGLDEFVRFMMGFNYDPGYGSEYVPPFIIKMNDGSWYERAEYDGSEWWEFNVTPAKPVYYSSIRAAIDNADASWLWPKAMKVACNCDVAYLAMMAEEQAAYESQVRRERMDALVDEIELDLDESHESGKWADYSGKCANKARCKRHVYNERRYELGGGCWSKPNSRCWKDQRGKGAKKRYHQYR